MDLSQYFPLLMLDDDVLSAVLSFLRPPDIARCACSSSKLRSLCSNDEKVWYQACQRRWGAFTCVRQWEVDTCPPPSPTPPSSLGSSPSVSVDPHSRPSLRRCQPAERFQSLYRNLDRWGTLIGCWRGVGETHMGSLVLFEWKERFIEGVRILPAKESSFSVIRVPFVRLCFARGNRVVCHMNADWPSEAEAMLNQISGGRHEQVLLGSTSRKPQDESAPGSSSAASDSFTARQSLGTPGRKSEQSPSPTLLQIQTPSPVSGLRFALQACSTLAGYTPCIMEADIELCGANHVAVRTVTALEGSAMWPVTHNPPSTPSSARISAADPGNLHAPPPSQEALGRDSDETIETEHAPPAEALAQGRTSEVPPAKLFPTPSPSFRKSKASAIVELLSSSPPNGFCLANKGLSSSGLARPSTAASGPLLFTSYEAVASRSEPSGIQKSARKQRRKGRALAEQLAASSGVRGQVSASLAAAMTGQAEHVVRISSLEPRVCSDRPLEGLWKGICQHKSLDFVLVSYDLPGSFRCRRVAQFKATPSADGQPHVSRSSYSRPGKVGTVRWTARIQSLVKGPLPAQDIEAYRGRRGFSEETDSVTARDGFSVDSDFIVGAYKSMPDPDCADSRGGLKPGRVWVYADGTFGYSAGHTDFTINYRPVWRGGRLCDDVTPV